MDKKLSGNVMRKLQGILFILVLLLLPIFFNSSPYIMMILCFCEIYVIAVTGLDILYGYSGQISFATSAFFGLGAYISLLVHNYTGLEIILCMLLSSFVSSLIAMILAYPISKLRFAFLSLATISFNWIVYLILTRSPGGITGDYNGAFTERMKLFGVNLKSYSSYYYFGLICALLFVLLKTNLVNSKVGRAFLAIKQNVHAAAGMGINVRKYKVYAFGFYGFYAAFAGSMYVHLVGYISPETAAQQESVAFMIMILLGGVCSNMGPVIGSIVIVLLKELLGQAEEYQLLVYGIILLALILFIPRGIVGEMKRLFGNISQRKGFKYGSESR